MTDEEKRAGKFWANFVPDAASEAPRYMQAMAAYGDAEYRRGIEEAARIVETALCYPPVITIRQELAAAIRERKP